MQWVIGLAILIGNGALEKGVELVICAEPGRTCCVSYTLPNFGDRAGKPLKTGELKFLVTDTAVTDAPEDAGGRIRFGRLRKLDASSRLPRKNNV